MDMLNPSSKILQNYTALTAKCAELEEALFAAGGGEHSECERAKKEIVPVLHDLREHPKGTPPPPLPPTPPTPPPTTATTITTTITMHRRHECLPRPPHAHGCDEWAH